MKKILISSFDLEIGGVERSLINMLNSFDYKNYDIDNFMIPESFINEPYHNLPNELLYYYSLNGWVDSIFSYMELRK